MARPSSLPEWDTTQVNSIAPDTTHKEEGWLAPGGVPEKPPFQTFNFWQNLVYRWLVYIDEMQATLELFADVRAISYIPEDGQLISPLGTNNIGDGFSGEFYWDALSVLTDNNRDVIKVDAISTGRFIKKNTILSSGLILDGQSGYSGRPKGQFAFLSDEEDPSSHAILTGVILNPGDEGALEFHVKYDDGTLDQISADFARTIDTGSGVGDEATARSIRGVHLNSTAKGDTTPLILWDGNSAGVCQGLTGDTPWEEQPIADGVFLVGVKTLQLQILTTTLSDTIIIQAYNNVSAALKELKLSTSKLTFGTAYIEPESNNTTTLGGSTKKFKRLWATDAVLDSLSLGSAVTYATGIGSPEGVLAGAEGSIYTNQSGGVGTTLYVKETGGTSNVGWSAK